MHIKFVLPFKVFSINKMSTRDARFKTAEYKTWATAILATLQEMQEYKSLMEMAADFKAKGGEFKVSFCATYPWHIFYNKDGAISSKTIDCTNFGKPLLDLIFGHTMDVNDKYVTECTEVKKVGATYSIEISIAHLF